jgi:pyridoxamine 5'-phosphate oxidase
MSRYDEAIQRLQGLLDQASRTDLPEPTAMTLATATPDGRPTARTVLLKGLDERGAVFYTNTLSRKGRDLESNPRAALCFYWQPLATQVLVEGTTQRVGDEEADAYWATRPRESQLGAWASAQSELLAARDELEARYAAYAHQYEGSAVPRPPHWTGYVLHPELIEFWQAMPGRMHVRERYYREDGEWLRSYVNP